ncbi:GntR family transcriptional regulator [Methylobacterium sp. sgz302541]|uniref:GntR family transcriptional regulator n=1 Tax=unclassified Methylobacterium TaxID=2615210 RepID=UPI003D33DFD1
MSTVPTRAESLSDQIANAILSGAFAPGTHLDEQVLARHFGVSRTPVRDALRMLNGTGLIELRPRFGATVRTITADELDMMFIAMGEIEATCARLATLSMSRAERDGLRALHERMGQMAEAGDQEGYVLANQDFHALIYVGAHNSVVESFALNLRRRLTPYRKAQFSAPGRLARSHAEHGLVVRAVLARDAAAANAAMLVHMSVVEDAFEALDAASAADREAAAEEARDRRDRAGGAAGKGTAARARR